MSAFTDRLELLLEKKGVLRADMCKATGITDSTVRGWYRNEDSMPNALYAVRMAEYLGTTVEYLITGIDPAHPVQYDAYEAKLLKDFRKLDQRDRETVLDLLEIMQKKYAFIPKENISG